jgi:outer membrane lipoprotein SlyB
MNKCHNSRTDPFTGAMIPGAGETGISEGAGYIVGGIVGAVGGATIGNKTTATLYDWTFSPGDPQ